MRKEDKKKKRNKKSKGEVRESESRTGTRLVSPGWRPRKKKFDLSIFMSGNTNLKVIITI
jgi:hypothetical protein